MLMGLAHVLSIYVHQSPAGVGFSRAPLRDRSTNDTQTAGNKEHCSTCIRDGRLVDPDVKLMHPFFLNNTNA